VVDGWKYWTMGWPIDQTDVINRAKVEPEDEEWEPDPAVPSFLPYSGDPEYRDRFANDRWKDGVYGIVDDPDRFVLPNA